MDARRVGQDFNRLGMDARNLGATYDNLGLSARNLGLDAYGRGAGAIDQAGQFARDRAGVSGDLFNAGDYYRNINQAGLDDRYRRHLEERDWGVRNLDILSGAMGGMPYGTTRTQPMERNAGAGFLGGAATGAGIGSNFGPWGTGIGAGIGGILGLF
jgi:hypothetical protein